MTDTFSPLNWQTISQCIPQELQHYIGEISVLETIDSTNAFLQDKPTVSKKMGICMAEHQTAGRGRRGRAWVNTANSNICLSVNWQFKQYGQNLSLLSLGVAVAICEALEKINISCDIKWPNDIYLSGEKLGGILIDAQTTNTGQCQMVIGCGLNVALSNEDSSAIDQENIDLVRYQQLNSGLVSAESIDRNLIIAEIINHLITLLIHTDNDNFSETIITAWKQRALYLNQKVNIYRKDNGDFMMAGVLVDISTSGALIVKNEAGKQVELIDSDVSIRLF